MAKTTSTVPESWCTRVFYFEGWLCLLSGLFMLVFPSLSLETMGVAASASGGVAAGNLRQFATMVILMGYVGVRAPVVKEVIEAALLADFLWMGAYAHMIQEHGAWTPGSIFSIGVTALLALTRISFLLFFCNSNSRSNKKGNDTSNKSA